MPQSLEPNQAFAITRETPCSAQATISVVIPVHRGGDEFRRCIKSIRDAIPPPHDIIVVVDGTDDGSGRIAKAFGARVTSTPSLSGPARARNIGAGMSHADILLFIDADVLIPSDAVGQVASAFRHQADLAAVFGSYDDSPDATNFVSQYKNLLHHYVHQTSCEQATTFWAGCGAIRRKIFLALGGFDERYRHASIEDIELGYRLTFAGHQIKLCKSLQVKHLKRWTAFSLLQSDFFRRALPWSELILQGRGFVNDLNLRHSGRASVASVYLLLAALIGALRWQSLLIPVSLMIPLLLTLNAPLYRFFHRRRGVLFALRAIPWHWFYFFYSGLAFTISVALYPFQRRRSTSSSLPAERADLSEPEGELTSQ